MSFGGLRLNIAGASLGAADMESKVFLIHEQRKKIQFWSVWMGLDDEVYWNI